MKSPSDVLRASGTGAGSGPGLKDAKDLSTRTRSGISGLDALIEGGFIKGSAISLCGDSGTGKTIFGLQYLYEGATKYDEPGLYISFDEHKRSMFRNMQRFGWNLTQLEKEKKLLVIEYPPYEVDHFSSQESVIHDLIDHMGIERMVIDSVTPLALLYEGEQTRRQGLLKLIDHIRSWDVTTLLISESVGDITVGAPRSRYGIEFLTDGLIYLYNVRRKNYRERALEVVKMRGVAHENKVCPMKITPAGMAVYPKQQFFDE
ncbi:Circadian clock protein kinase KaiC [Candidatus Burarchaeum australiense]|nr:Circadian clock protein kinase KaiC [Candidatus Burarchaeum australiense]